MPLLILAIVVMVVLVIVTRKRGPTRNCRWREDRAGSKGALIKYNCVTCGAEAFRSNGQPRQCLAKLPGSRL